MIRSIVIIVLIILSSIAFADKKLPIPRFVTVKFNEVNARTGPAVDCPIEWVFIKKGEPIEIVAEYEQWRKVRDFKGEGGWVNASGISGKRSVIITAKNTIPLLSAPGKYDKIVVKVSPGVRCGFKKCEGDWCQIECQDYKGWISKKYLWGVYPED
jgi:SH3-like domain-containing protein